MSTLTQDLARLIADKPIGAEDLRMARFFLIDAAANTVAGRNSPAGRKLLKWARDIAPDGNINALDPARKAFLLGALCHILEVDDLHRASVVHPGCVVAPVIYSLATSQPGGQPGIKALTAFLKGVEATTRVGMAVGPEHYKIWHNTATCGPYGSALAAAHLLDLSNDQTVHALGNAGSQSAGFWQFLDSGAETKHLHAGRGAEAGLVAAQLAAHGFTGAPDILEGARGFFKATCTNPPIDNLLANPNGPWQIHLNSIKPWPCCRHTHPAIEAALLLQQNTQASANEIESVVIDTYQAAINLCDRPQPESVYGAKFSLQHCVATALATGNVDLTSFDEEARSKVADLASKITLNRTEKYQRKYPVQWGAAVTLNFSNQAPIRQEITATKGDPDAPLSEKELISKTNNLLAWSGIAQPDHLLEQLLQLTDDGPVPDLTTLLA